MKKSNVTMLILSCDKFSDLWDGHIKLLEKNWDDRNMLTYMVTEGKEEKKYKNVSFIKTGENLEWSERLAYALNKVETEYVFVTLDDYYLVEKVDNDKINKILSLMNEHQLDYVRLFKRPTKATKKEVVKDSKVKWIDTKIKYSVNLYAGIWRRDFLLSMITKKKNAWQFEVGLSKNASLYGARCAVSGNNEFQILDVVRKGKLLHKAAKYFKKHPGIYEGNRKVQTWSYEIKLGIRTLISRHMPSSIYPFVKKVTKKMGYIFFSDEVEK